MPEKYVKEISKEDAEKVRTLLNGLGMESERYKLMALGRSDIEYEVEVSFLNIKNFLGDKYASYALDGKKPNELFDVETEQGKNDRSKLIALQTDFYFKSLRFVEISKDMMKVYQEIKNLRKQREKFSQKMFKKYKLNGALSYKFDADNCCILEVTPEVPSEVNQKVN